jgi:thiamine monophosphate kinase
MIDVSDGFILDLYRILKESKKGALIHLDDIPYNYSPSDLFRGEDYELIFTIDKSEPKLGLLRQKFYLVGRITSRGYKIVKDNKIENVKVKGYMHF